MTTPTVALNYNDFVTQIANMGVYQVQTVGGVVQGVDPEFNTLIPQAINFAELKIQRDIDLLPLQTSNSYSFVQGSNLFQVPVADFVVVRTVQALVNGVPFPLTQASLEWMQAVYNDPNVTGQPVRFAMIGGDQATAGQTFTEIMVGPYPDQSYPATVFGSARMPSLNLNNSNPLASTAYTFISTWLPDLMIQAAMIYVAEFQRQFGATGNDPQMGLSYEAQYQSLLSGAQVEEARKRFAATAYSSASPPVAATPE